MLVLAGADRIDKELMIAQMQGESRRRFHSSFFIRSEVRKLILPRRLPFVDS